MSIHHRLFLTTLCVLTAGILSAADRPNFTGQWKLNLEKSNFGPMPAPASQTMKIDHTDPDLVTTTDQEGEQGKLSYVIKYKTDGSEVVNDIRGAQAKSVGKWEGEVIVFTTKLDYQGTEITLNNTMKMDPGGKNMSAVTKVQTPQGEFEQSLVFDKVEAAK